MHLHNSSFFSIEYLHSKTKVGQNVAVLLMLITLNGTKVMLRIARNPVAILKIPYTHPVFPARAV